MLTDSEFLPVSDHADARRAWVKPHYSKMKAGDAESGPQFDVDDDFFTKS